MTDLMKIPVRALAILRALTGTPGGLSTTDLAEAARLIPSDCWTTLRFHERKGRVTRIGHAGKGVADTWQITEEGQHYLAVLERG